MPIVAEWWHGGSTGRNVDTGRWSACNTRAETFPI